MITGDRSILLELRARRHDADAAEAFALARHAAREWARCRRLAATLLTSAELAAHWHQELELRLFERRVAARAAAEARAEVGRILS
jgi:hypothetical protein